MIRRLAGLSGLAAAALLAAAVPAAAPAAAVPAHLLFKITDRRIDEASGIAVGIASPGVLYVHNDSGDVNRFFALNARTGATVATITVPGATNVDWEDIAVAPDTAGRPSVWLADIGDNGAQRHEVDVYRVAEPRIAATERNRALTASRPDVWRLRYPSGPTNAESFAVTPQGVGYVVTKSITGASTVYRLPPHPNPDSVQPLRRVGAIRFAPTGTPDAFGVIAELTATSAAIAPDGSLFAVRTYTDAYLWALHDGDVAAALAHAPTRIELPSQPQGEGIAFDGTRLLVDSEGVGTAVYAVSLPSTPSASAPLRSPTSGTSASRTVSDRAPPRSDTSGYLLGGIAAGCAALGIVAVIIARRGRKRTPGRGTTRDTRAG